MSALHIDTISLDAFNDVLSRYPSAVPDKLQELDTLRYDTIPSTVVERQDAAYLTKDEVEKLVEWKLKHGTFRPKLLSLVQSNDSETIVQSTKKVSEFLADVDLDGTTPSSSPLPALKILTQFKGIGPATASLLLSVMKPDSIPFFSDELFRWCLWDDSGSPRGWKRGIKYNVKEYAELVERVKGLRKRLNVRAVDIERVAWVLGREGVDVGNGENGHVKGEKAEQAKGTADNGKEAETEQAKSVEQAAKEKIEDSVEKPPKQTSKAGTKRKAREAKLPAEGTRKSSRTKN
ncbi:hypothetical protein BKA66DRAFT_465541 [Pyrenochaeta sp. MPI-SDFR-AT-0127]|nr:hypothetical protein BKA66DRAFT_465541 [Pyrenochaeta sp. MPI-SDFR-AT-0127]